MAEFGLLDRDDLTRGREAFRRREWAAAFKDFTLADEAKSLQAEDLALLAWSGYLIGRQDDFLKAMERAQHEHLAASEVGRAARCAFWLGFVLASRGEIGPATGWFARAGRLVEREGGDCVELGYLLLPTILQHALAGSWESVRATALEAVVIGERFAEADV